MQALDKSLRNTFEKTILKARSVAEDAAKAALGEIGVADAQEAAYLTSEKKELRKKLRAHSRQLGDEKAADGSQGTERLVEEIAYEHWHRMLFARFLAENELLMYPDPVSPVAVTLADCDDLAKEEGATSGWELAARFAARMLPQIFRPDSPVFSLVLPPEYQQKLEALVKDLPKDIFTASDSLGWAYQFWQTDNKEKINKSEVKIGARELPAVTQLFTEPYMVSFLLDNSLGAWWAARRLSADDLRNAATEEELRKKASLPGVPLEYLRFVQTDDGVWTPAAGTFDKWPEHLKDFKALDPCCGSGHFLVALLQMLVPLRMEMEGFSAEEAVDHVLSDNIHGLELDSRCVELAAFALAFAAWRYPDAGHYRVLPALNVACSGLAISAKKEKWLELAKDDSDLIRGLDELYTHFSKAPLLGSLINPKGNIGKDSLFEIKWADIEPVLFNALKNEDNIEKLEVGVIAKGILKAASLLSSTYCFVVTNVPYLSLNRQSPELKDFSEQNYFDSRHDLANVFISRITDMLQENGILCIVAPQNWMFLKRYNRFRELMIKSQTFNIVARLGSSAFETITGEVVKAILFISTKKKLGTNSFTGINVEQNTTSVEKSFGLKNESIIPISQNDQLNNPDKIITLECVEQNVLLTKYASALSGCSAGDGIRFIRKCWELTIPNINWEFHQTTVTNTCLFGGKSEVIFWESEKGEMQALAQSVKHMNHAAQNWLRGKPNWGKLGVVISQIGKLPATLYTGAIYDCNCCAIIPNDPEQISSLWTYCSSESFNSDIRKLNQKLNVTPKTLLSVPFKPNEWKQESLQQYPNGLPKPYSNDPTQWIFHGHPCGSTFWDANIKWTAVGEARIDDTVLQIAVARLLGYRWPAELDKEMELADEQRALVASCETLLDFADKDGIVCIPAVRGERSAADRLLDLLVAAYGKAWKNDTLGSLLAASDHAGKTLETWLRDKFFAQHCKLFQHRPFVWQIWDGLKDGFSALVNYHTLDYKKLETLIYTYLGDWINRQKLDLAGKVDGAQEKLDAAERLKKKLELILQGEAPYDIFVRWKPLAEQSIGWNPDLNDGVRLNIRPFITAEVLRFNKKPQINIAWDKDRGKDVESAPWYKTFGGERINDHHLTLEEKQKAREGKK